jgi:signal transduction histidine kinase
VRDYASAPTITHHFDARIAAEGIQGLFAAPVFVDGRVAAVLYAGARSPEGFGDATLGVLLDIARETSRALEVCRQVESHTSAVLTADRQRVSVALHDSVGALLFGIGAEVRDLRTADGVNPELERRLRRIEAQVSAAASALRESLESLAPTACEEELPAAAAGDCRAFAERTGLTARAIVLGELPPLDRHRTDLLRQVVREGLLNVEKHARATSVLVSLSRAARGVMVAVADDGRGLRSARRRCETAHSSGMGLRSLGDRLAQIGGSLSPVDAEDGGFTLRAWCPCP